MNFFGCLNKRFFISERGFKGDTQKKVTVRQKFEFAVRSPRVLAYLKAWSHSM
jgi:hypothetical protein